MHSKHFLDPEISVWASHSSMSPKIVQAFQIVQTVEVLQNHPNPSWSSTSITQLNAILALEPLRTIQKRYFVPKLFNLCVQASDILNDSQRPPPGSFHSVSVSLPCTQPQSNRRKSISNLPPTSRLSFCVTSVCHRKRLAFCLTYWRHRKRLSQKVCLAADTW